MRRWKALKSLVHAAVDHTTRLIEEGHESVARTVMTVLDEVEPVREPARIVDGARRAITHGVLESVRTVNRVVQVVTDAGIDGVARVLEVETDPAPIPVALRSDALETLAGAGDVALGALNGVIGDTLEAQGNALDLGMALRTRDCFLGANDEATRRALAEATGDLVLFVHGLCATEWSWCLESEAYHGAPEINFGVLLERELRFTPVYARYNSGRRVSINGRALAEALEALTRVWPVPLERVVLVGHSMGGLVCRSACAYAERDRMRWRERLTHVVSLGSPHHGAPLEKVGNVLTAALLSIDWPATKIPGRILQARSAGIKDLRYGNVLDDDWLGHDPDALLEDTRVDRSGLALLDGVSYCFVSATVSDDPEHPMGKIIGDLLVRAPSAEAEGVSRRSFAIETRRFGGILHHQLQNHPDVYAQIRDFIADAEPFEARVQRSRV